MVPLATFVAACCTLATSRCFGEDARLVLVKRAKLRTARFLHYVCACNARTRDVQPRPNARRATSPRERDLESCRSSPAPRSSMASTCLLSLVIVASGSAGDRPALRHASRAQLAQGQGAGWLSALAEAPGWAQHDYANLVALPVLSGLTIAALLFCSCRQRTPVVAGPSRWAERR